MPDHSHSHARGRNQKDRSGRRPATTTTCGIHPSVWCGISCIASPRRAWRARSIGDPDQRS